MPRLAYWIFFIALFLIFSLPPTDPDLGWHLRCGQEFWQGQGFCGQNHFTVLLENYSWPNHAWLYQAVIFPIFKFAGLWGLTIFNALLITAAFAFLYLAIKNFQLEKMLLILLTIYFGWGVFSFGIRSQLVGFFFFNLILYLLTKLPAQIQHPPHRKHYLIYALIPLTMLVWANSHGSVILGLILIFLFNLGAAVGKRERIISGLVTLINPFGFRIYEEAWRHFAGVGLSKLIAEWVPPVPTVWWLILLSGLGLSLYLFLTTGPEDKISALLVLLFTYLALKARRNAPFYFSLSSYIFLTAPRTKSILAAWLNDKETRHYLAGLLVILLLAYGLLVRLPQTRRANSSWQSYVQNLPVSPPLEGVEFLQAQEDKGNIFNRYEIGGFLIWQLPEYKIFVDGRMPAWEHPSGKSPYTIYLETLQTRPGWEETLKAHNINWILISPGNFMDLKLKPKPGDFGWQEVYRDKVSVIYKKL